MLERHNIRVSEEYKEQLALKLKTARLERGLSRERLGQASAMSARTIENIEHMRIKVKPYYHTLLKLERALNIDLTGAYRTSQEEYEGLSPSARDQMDAARAFESGLPDFNSER